MSMFMRGALAIGLPAFAAVLGCLLATFRAPTPDQRSVIRHFTAGVIYAAAATDVLPDLLRQHTPGAAFLLSLGVTLGVALMLAVRVFSGWLEYRTQQRQPDSQPKNRTRPASSKGKRRVHGRRRTATTASQKSQQTTHARSEQAQPPTSLIALTAVDVALDGLTLGVVFSLGAQQAIVITIALAIEIFFLGVSIGGDLALAGVSRLCSIGLSSIPAGAFAGAALLGVGVLTHLPAVALEVVIAAGLVALLYLATEELLTEAHEAPETPLTTAIFFVGFLVIVIYALLAGGPNGQ